MSGKKASDVSSLLNQGAQAREVSEKGFAKFFNAAKIQIVELNKVQENVNKQTGGVDVKVSEECRLEFAEAANKLEMSLKNCRKDLQRKSIDFDKIESENQKLLNEFYQTDLEADSLREIIRTKSHYCNDEFREAEKIIVKYNQLAESRDKLRSAVQKKEQDARCELSALKTNYEKFEVLVRQIEDLNKRAAEIVNLRTKAEEAKSAVDAEFGKIDPQIAEKFMNTEYQELTEKNASFQKADDKTAIDGVNVLMSEVTVFAENLRDAYTKFLELKRSAEEKYAAIQSVLNKPVYEHPEMHFKKNVNEQERFISLGCFLELYGKGQYMAEIASQTAEVDAAIRNEKHQEAFEMMEILNETIDNASAFAGKSQDRLVATIDMALRLKNAMKQLHYKVFVEKIDGDLLKGYSMKCTGNDKIVLEEINIDENGTPVIKIDHTEHISGTCGVTWNEIVDTWNAHGIPTEDITKDGRSVLTKNNQGKNPPKSEKKLARG